MDNELELNLDNLDVSKKVTIGADEYFIIPLPQALDVTQENEGGYFFVTHRIEGFDNEVLLIIVDKGDEGGHFFFGEVVEHSDNYALQTIEDKEIADKAFEVLKEGMKNSGVATATRKED